MKQCPKCDFTFPDFHRVCDFDGTELVKDPELRALVKVKERPLASRLWRSIASPVVWAVVMLSGVLASAFLFAYYDVARQSRPVVTSPPTPAAPARAIPAAAASDQSARALDQSAQIETTVSSTRGTKINSSRLARSSSARSFSASLRRRARAPHSLARLDQKRSDSDTVSTTRGSGWVKSHKSETARSQKPDTARLQTEVARSQKSEIAHLQKSELVRGNEAQPISHEKEPRLTAMLKTTWRVLKWPFKF